MKIAVATSNDIDVDHFGKAQGFMIYEFDEKNMNFSKKENLIK